MSQLGQTATWLIASTSFRMGLTADIAVYDDTPWIGAIIPLARE
jgi:hypothetical protein